MKASRVVLVAAILVLCVLAVLPVSAAQMPSSNVFQSPTDTPIPGPTDTNTPAPTNTSTPAPTNTSAPVPTNTSMPSPIATPTPFPVCTPPPCSSPGYLTCGNPNGCPGGCGTICVVPPSYTIIAYWTVQPGHTLYCIGRYYKVSPWAIASVNYIPWPYWIYPGQVLAIPNAPWYNIPPGPVCYPGVPNVTPTPPANITPTPPANVTPTPPAITPTPPAPQACRYYHYVQWGQTLSGIAWYYHTTIQAIMYANPSITNPNLIYAGSTLCIP